jgi:hypothetical protein
MSNEGSIAPLFGEAGWQLKGLLIVQFPTLVRSSTNVRQLIRTYRQGLERRLSFTIRSAVFRIFFFTGGPPHKEKQR